MKTLRSALLVAVLLPTLASGAGAPQPPAKAETSQAPALGSERERLSYALGVDAINKLRRQGIAVDADSFARGMKDVAERRPLAMTEDEVHKTIANQHAKMRLKSRFTGREKEKSGEGTPQAPAANPRP